MRRQPIGVLDSGVGCLTVLSALTKHMPSEDWLVLQDSEVAAYGQLAEGEIIARTEILVQRLVSAGVKAIVLACHTSSALALGAVSRDCPVPVFGVLAPTAEALAQDFTQDCILWLATSASIRANKLPSSAKLLGFCGQIFPLACPGWVDGVESGSWETPQFRTDMSEHLAAYRGEIRQDWLVLYGCTHYPWLHPVISTLLPAGVRYLDPAAWVARHVHQGLAEKRLLVEDNKQGEVRCLEGNTLLQRWHRYQEIQVGL